MKVNNFWYIYYFLQNSIIWVRAGIIKLLTDFGIDALTLMFYTDASRAHNLGYGGVFQNQKWWQVAGRFCRKLPTKYRIFGTICCNSRCLFMV